MNTILTDSWESANRVLQALLVSATVESANRTGTGWRIEFAIPPTVAELSDVSTMVLEEGCDERVRRYGRKGWSSAQSELEELLLRSPGRKVTSIVTDQLGVLEIGFENCFELKLVPADFSPDWQWTITPSNQSMLEVISIVSVHGETIWTRYPESLSPTG